MNVDISDFIKVVGRELDAVTKHSVTVGVMTNRMAAIGDVDKEPIPLPNDRTYSVKRLPLLLGKAGKSDKTLKQLALELDTQRGIFTRFKIRNKYNKDVTDVAELFAELVGNTDNPPPALIKQLENACRAMIRNPLLYGAYGGNSPSWAAIKGNNKFGIATGTLFGNITAHYA